MEQSTKLTASEALAMLRDSWNKGVLLSQDNTAARLTQRAVIASRVKQLRTDAGISQEKFSDMVGAAFLTYKGYENRKSDIPIHTLVRIANTLGASMDFLTGRTDTVNANSLEDRIRRLEEITGANQTTQA